MEAGADGGGTGSAGLDDADAAFFSCRRHRCCCFSAPWHASSSASGGSDEEWWHRVGGSSGGAERRKWWRRGADALMKVREWSELVAGPRWKTFIRRFRRSPRHGSGSGRKLNYDPLSYALNFDEGHAAAPEGEEYPDFSARYAAPPGSTSTRSSMDLGSREATSPFRHSQPHTPPIAAARG